MGLHISFGSLHGGEKGERKRFRDRSASNAGPGYGLTTNERRNKWGRGDRMPDIYVVIVWSLLLCDFSDLDRAEGSFFFLGADPGP